MKRAFMGIGVAGSGKTTLLKPLAETHGLVYINTDTIAEQRFGHPHVQARREVIGGEADRLALAGLASGTSVVFDSTFVDIDKRRRKIHFLRERGADRIIGIFFDTPFAIAQERNRARRFVVPSPVMEWQREQLTMHPPGIKDGFDRLYRFEELDDLERNELV
jgi:predicted kinase